MHRLLLVIVGLAASVYGAGDADGRNSAPDAQKLHLQPGELVGDMTIVSQEKGKKRNGAYHRQSATREKQKKSKEREKKEEEEKTKKTDLCFQLFSAPFILDSSDGILKVYGSTWFEKPDKRRRGEIRS
jgi:hypothetical protein